MERGIDINYKIYGSRIYSTFFVTIAFQRGLVLPGIIPFKPANKKRFFFNNHYMQGGSKGHV